MYLLVNYFSNQNQTRMVAVAFYQSKNLSKLPSVHIAVTKRMIREIFIIEGFKATTWCDHMTDCK